MRRSEQSADVVIVGAGPVGLATALFLAERHVRVLVLEREHKLPTDMRASTFHASTLGLLDRQRIAEVLLAQGHAAPQWQYLRTDTGERIVFDLSVLAAHTRFPLRLQCEQYKLTRAIVERLGEVAGFQIRFGCGLVGLERAGSERPGGLVSLRVRGTDGREQLLRAPFVVGADGAHSTVREQLGMVLEGETYPRTSITVVVDFPFERHLRDLLAVNYVWTATDHYSLMRVRDAWRTGFSPESNQSVEAAMSAGIVEAHLQRILPRPGSRYRVSHVGAYTVHRRVAAAFNDGRVALAGDAAHLNSPSGGLGMNSGIHDAAMLAEALLTSLESDDPGALASYSQVRRAVALEDVQLQSDRNYRRHRERDPAQRERIWAELKAPVQDRARLLDSLLESSMIASLERARARMQELEAQRKAQVA